MVLTLRKKLGMILYMAPGNIRLYLNTTFNLPIAYLSDLVTLDSSLPPLTVSVAALSRQKGVKVK